MAIGAALPDRFWFVEFFYSVCSLPDIDKEIPHLTH